MNILITFGLFVFIFCCAISFAIGRKRSEESEDLGKVTGTMPSNPSSPATCPVNFMEIPSLFWIPSLAWKDRCLAWRDQAIGDTREDSFMETED